MIKIQHTTGADPRSLVLREDMDAETFALYGDYFDGLTASRRELVDTALHTEQADLFAVVIAVEDGEDLGHAALRRLATVDDAYGGLEVKKVYVRPAARGRGLSRLLMTAIEEVARELGEPGIQLQTGPRQHEAIALYRALGYADSQPFGPYRGLDDMVYFAKML